MDLTTSLTRVEAALTAQLALLGGEPAFGASAEALYAVLEPAFRQLGMDLAQQAAAEVAAQLPDHDVHVVLADGEPSLRVRTGEATDPPPTDDFDARVTLRLPESLKQLIEEQADHAGDSVNSWVVKTLATRSRRTGSAPQPGAGQGEFET